MPLKENLAQIKQSVAVLSGLANRINSEALIDQISRLEMHSSQGLIDNITIAWPSIRKSILTTMRVIYSHLHA
jgi:epidermal growth factor receptor substrate 15